MSKELVGHNPMNTSSLESHLVLPCIETTFTCSRKITCIFPNHTKDWFVYWSHLAKIMTS